MNLYLLVEAILIYLVLYYLYYFVAPHIAAWYWRGKINEIYVNNKRGSDLFPGTEKWPVRTLAAAMDRIPKIVNKAFDVRVK